LSTLVREGATIGAGCTIGSDLVIGRFAMIGMGSTVTKSVGDFHLAIGQPARLTGYVCRCGKLLGRVSGEASPQPIRLRCSSCGLKYAVAGEEVTELMAPP
jgi:hypothetical protein